MEPAGQLIVTAVSVICTVLFSRLLLPMLRRLRTGKFDIYIGDRFKKDGSEPSGGGAAMLPALAVGLGTGCAVGAAGLRMALYGLVYCAVLTVFGLREDILRDRTGGIGMKGIYRFGIKTGLAAVLVVLMKGCGYDASTVLLPFRMGYLDLGRGYVPLTALLLAGIVTCVEQHDCHKGIHDTGVDGLCLSSCGIGMMGLMAAFSSAVTRGDGAVMAACGTGIALGGLFYCMSPGKMYIGSSGAMCLGGIFGMILLTTGLHGAVLLCMTGPIIDGMGALLQRAVFRINKKLLLRGASLREHLRNNGMNDYGIMAFFGILQAAGGVLAVVYAVYESRLVI